MTYTATASHGKDISYAELAERIGDCILANVASEEATKIEDGMMQEFCGSLYNEETDTFTDVYQSYIITQSGAEYLKSHTDEIVTYSSVFDLYFWNITHYGTSWTNVFTSIK